MGWRAPPLPIPPEEEGPPQQELDDEEVGEEGDPEQPGEDRGHNAAEEVEREGQGDEDPRGQYPQPSKRTRTNLKNLQATLARKTYLPKVRKIHGKINRNILQDIDAALGEALRQVETKDRPPSEKRRRKKTAMLAAGILLERETRPRKPGRPPRYILSAGSRH